VTEVEDPEEDARNVKSMNETKNSNDSVAVDAEGRKDIDKADNIVRELDPIVPLESP
jgi:hypothetical protein